MKISTTNDDMATKPMNTNARRRTRATKNGSSTEEKQNNESNTNTTNGSAKDVDVPQWMLDLGVFPSTARRVIMRKPFVLDLDYDQDILPALEFLKAPLLSMTDRQIASAVQFGPQLFTKGVEDLKVRIKFLMEVAKIQSVHLGLATSKAPHILWMDLENAQDVVEYVYKCCPHLTEKELGHVMTRVPRILLMRPGEVGKRINFLKTECGIEDSYALTKIVVTAPRCLVYEVETTLSRKLAYLRENLALPRDTIAKVLTATPAILDSSIQNHLKPVISTVQVALDLPHEELKNLLHKAPGLFEVKGVADRWKWLKDTVALTDEEISKVVRTVPAVLTYSVKSNLQRKWDFICRTMGGSKQDIVAAPVQTLAVSLQQRAMPRHAFLVSRGISGFSAADVLRPSDYQFCTDIAKCEYSDYRNYVDSDRFLLFYTQLM